MINAELGEYFILPRAEGSQWRSHSDLLSGPNLISFVDLTRTAIANSCQCDLDQISLRVAASAFQLGIASRVLSPLIGTIICNNALPVIDPSNLYWRSAGHHPTFSVGDTTLLEVHSTEHAAQALSDYILKPIVAPLNDGLRTLASLSPKVAWGNVVSAANGAVTVLSMSRPHLQQAGRDLVRALTETQALSGTGAFNHGAFRRRSCCLFYQVPGSGLCGDCVLTGPETSQ